MTPQKVCVIGPKVDGLGFDLGPIIDTISAAGSKYLDYKAAQDKAKTDATMARMLELQQQQRVIAAGAGGISGGVLALVAVGAFFLLSQRRRS